MRGNSEVLLPWNGIGEEMVSKRRHRGKKRKGGSKRAKITINEKAQIIQKNDKIKVQQPDTLRTMKKAPFIINDNGLNMRIKIKRKSR